MSPPADSADVAIVGAGPAGLAAAALLDAHGVDVCVVDEQERAGGQIYRQPPATFRLAPGHASRGDAGAKLIEAAERTSGVRWMTSTAAWGVFDDPSESELITLMLVDREAVGQLTARRLLLAPGAYDLPVAFPGWTLPGVMAVGGLQAFLKAQRLLVGRRIALVGAHPLLLVVAGQLLAAGADLAIVAFAQPRPQARSLMRTFGLRGAAVRRVGEVAGPLRRLRAHKVPVVFGEVVVAAEGGNTVDSIRLARVDERWKPTGAGERVVECDTVALGYGFVPSTELARQARCAHVWRPSGGGWVIDHDRWMASSRPEIYVAGEITGISGAAQAAEEGRLAAVGILRDLGRISDEDAERLAGRLERKLAPLRRFNRAMERQFAPRLEVLPELATDETVVCRCEELTAGRLRAALQANPHLGTLDSLKLLTRAGMGQCQGRFCQCTAAAILAGARGTTLAEVGPFTAQAPVKPLPLGLLVASASEAASASTDPVESGAGHA